MGPTLPYRRNTAEILSPSPATDIYSGYHWRSVQTCSLMNLPPLLPVVLTSSGGHQKWALRILLEC